MSETARPSVILLAQDILFSTRVANGLAALGYEVRVIDEADAFLERLAGSRPDLIMLDLGSKGLDWPALVAEAKADARGPIPVLAFGPHMDLELRQRALQAGCDLVVARSRMVGDLQSLVARLTATSKA